MSENIYKLTRDLTKDISSKGPDTYIHTQAFEDALKRFFSDEARHGTVYVPADCSGLLCINPSAFVKGLGLIFAGAEKGATKTIEAKTVEKNFVLYIKVDGKLPTRRDLAVVSRIMFMAGFKFSCNENTIRLVTELSRQTTLSLYENEIDKIYNLLYYEFMFV